MREKSVIHVKVNGIDYEKAVGNSTTLLEFIRGDLGLTGAKAGCENGECGACTVLMNGQPVRSCLILAVEADGAEIVTVEGVADVDLHPLQQAFIDEGAVQCGFCSPGMLIAAKALIERKPDPNYEDIKTALGGHLCRCGAYEAIGRAVESAAGK